MNKFKSRIIGFFVLGAMLGLVLLVGIARLSWHSKFYPGVEIAGQRVGGMTREEAKLKLKEMVSNYQPSFKFNGSSWVAPKEAAAYEIEATLNESYHYGRRLKISDYLLLLINKKTNYPLTLAAGKTEKMSALVDEISSEIEIPPIEPSIELVGKKIKISNGKEGIVVDSAVLDKRIAENFGYLSGENIVIPTVTVNPTLTTEKMAKIEENANKLLDKNLNMSVENEKFVISTGEMLTFLSTKNSGEVVDPAAIQDYVTKLSEGVNKGPQDAKFEFNSGKVVEFAPGKDGIEVNIGLTADSIKQGMKKLLESDDKSETVELVVKRTPPQVTTDKVNELGIKELIGRGESYYQHSIPNRIYNVALASSRINSALIGPGEEVSFNKMVGEVSGATGYRPAYIISGGRTVLGDGGGLCQVSTTMFRAAMAAGLPILERWGHAYRVSYYELNSKPGVDATVIAPSKDFRFRNDTPGHILVQTLNDPKKLHLVIEIYGTNDGRVASISEPKVWGITPPLPTIYQDDPTLPVGTTKQVDWAASGAKASFEYKVERNGEVLQEKTFTTNYQPWASVFMRGTAQ